MSAFWRNLRSGLVAGGALCAALLSGCWAAHGGRVWLDPELPRQGIQTVAVLPVLNQTSVDMPLDGLQAVLSAQLAHEKHFAVVPPSKVYARLRSGGGAAAFTRLINALNLEQDAPDEAFAEMARALEADALLLESVQAFHQLQEEGMGATLNGGTYATTFPVTVVQVRGLLWGARAGAPVWRNEFLERYYADPEREGRNSYQPALVTATRGLLASLPENTWAPAAEPAATPRPAPVTSLAPIPYPVDPESR
jgi:hypothetical protein